MTITSAQTMAALVLGLVIAGGSFATASAQCLASTRDVRFADGSARLKNYVCKLGNAAEPQLRVEFDRLSEAAAGSLLQGEPYPELERAFGRPRVLANPVQAEAKKLFDQFGTRQSEFSCFRFTVDAGTGERGYDQKDGRQPCGKRTLWYLTFPDQEDLTAIQMPLPDELRYVQSNTGWPPDFSFFYNRCTQKSLIGCTLIWRPARAADFADYDKNHKAWEAMLGLDSPPDAPADASPAPADSDARDYETSRKRYFSLVEYLSRDGWRDDFLIITGEPVEEGCGGLDFQLRIRQLVLDVAFVENISREAISLEGLLGAAGAETGLRKGEQRAGSGTIAMPPIQLGPGQTLAIPLRMSFVPEAGVQNLFKDQAAARATFSRIQALRRGTVITQRGVSPPLRKTRESFAPPTVPSFAPYFYGPELDLRGVVLNGRHLDFESAARNFMRLTAGEGYGSCPYLYAFDGESWVRRGKVIHEANGKEREGTQRVSFAGLISKFRLSEEEFEVSYIDSVSLELELADGSRVLLRPDVASLVEQDGQYVVIRAWETLELEFKLSPDLPTAQVARSTLEVTGYYRPYSRMLIGER